MSRITGSEAKSLMEAYAAVYASQEQEITEEQIWEEVENWVNSLLEEGYDLSDHTWEEMYKSYIEEVWGTNQIMRNQQKQQKAQAATTAKKIDAGEVIKTGTAGALNNLGLGRATSLQRNKAGNLNVLPGSVGGLEKTIKLGGRSYDRLTQGDKVTYMRRGAAATPVIPASDTRKDNKGGNNIPPKPSQTKVVPSKPVSAGQTGDKSKDMASWAKANPNLAAAAAEKARIRGTAQTDNPMIDKGMRSRMQVTPTVQSPTLQKDLGNLAKNYTSLTQNKFAGQSPTPPVKAATPSQAIAAAPKPSAAASGSLAPATASIAAKPSSAMSQDAIRKQRLNMEMEYDAYDLVLEYLIDNGHADTVDEAHYLMIEMDAQMVGDIVEEVLDEKKGERPRGLPYGPVGKGFRELTVPQRAKMIKRGKEHTRAAMNSSDEYGDSHAKSSAIDSALRSRRLGGRG